MASTAARATCAFVVPRVIPMMVPRAYGSQCGAPSPTRAGTKYTSPVFGTDSASGPTSDACSMIPNPSRSHCTAAPVTKIEPSNAYSTFPPGPDAMVVIRPDDDVETSRPVFINTNEPVPYVFFVAPGLKQAWPNSAACWSPAIPEMGTAAPKKALGSVTPNRPDEGIASGSTDRGTPSRPDRSRSQSRPRMSNSIVREAFV